jgi:hypothetical protein
MPLAPATSRPLANFASSLMGSLLMSSMFIIAP